MVYKILGLFANHTCNNIKYNISLNNILMIYKYLTNICIIDTINQNYGNKLYNNLKNFSIINNYFFIENDNYFDFGKWIYALKNIDYSSYDYILLINDSIILSNEINKFFIYLNNINDNINLYGYNDSSQIKYHYQSYFFIINIKIVNKFINFIESKKNLIFDLNSLVHNIELNLCEIDQNHDCFIKIGNEYNKDKNLYWENETLYKYLLTKKIFSIVKLKKIIDIQKEYKFVVYDKNIKNFNYNFYRTYYNYNNLSDQELLIDFIENGQHEGKKHIPSFNVLLPDYYREFLNNIGLLYFFDVPEDFDIYYYKKNSKDINDLNLIDTIFHYINIGYHQGRKYNKDNIIYSNNVKNFYEKINNTKLYNNNEFNFNYEINEINDINNEIDLDSKIPEDFNLLIYKNNYNDLIKLNNEELINHYINYGKKEGRIYDKYLIKKCILPEDFNPYIYKNIYKDLENLNENELKEHYLNNGINEGRFYKIPEDFNPYIYKNIYKDLENLNENELKEHYLNNGINEGRFYKIPEDFNPCIYKNIYEDLKLLNNNELIIHYINNGIKEKRIYKIPDDFSPLIYKNIYNDIKDLNENELKEHYLFYGIKENRIYKN